MNRSALFLPALLLALVALHASSRDGQAQQKGGPGQPNPQAPTLAISAPYGMQRGTSLELTLTGTNLADPVGLWTSFPAQVTIPTDNNNGKDAAKLRVRLDVPPDAPLGTHAIRLATARGVSNLRVFCIDELPQVAEVDTNRARTTPQPVPIPCVVVGRADAETSDYYKISVKAGQRVSFEVIGRRLGSAFDPQISLYDPRTGRELPGGHSNDSPGLQTDARLTYTFKEAGDYLVEVRDVMYRGGADYGYRLRIGDFPCATTPLPMAVRRGTQATVQFAGSTVDGVAPVEVFVPTELSVDSVPLAPRGANGLHGWPVTLALSDIPEITEQEPNNEPAKAMRLTPPVGVTGRFQQSGDPDHYVFSAKKGQRLILQAHTHELYSPTEVYLVLRDAKGVQVAASNPAQAPRLDFTAPADGDYTLLVEHLLYWGGPAETYRLTLQPYEPGFTLGLPLDRFDVAPGSVTAVPLTVTRRDYNGPIEVTVVGPPGISGEVIIPAGTASPAPKPGQPAPPAATLFLQARPDLPPGPGVLAVQGRATINGKTVVDRASVRTLVSQALGNLPYPPPAFDTQVALGVTEKPPFTLALRIDQAEALRGSPVPVTVTVQRAPGFNDEIALSAVGLPANVTAAVKNVPAGQAEIKGQLTPAANAALGPFPLSFSGKAKYQNREVTVTAPPALVQLVTPFDLRAEAVPLKLAPGSKAKLRVTAVRHAGHQAPIKLQVRNLPANVTAPEATLAMGQNTVEIELTAAANAAAGDKGDVNVLGSTEAPAKEQVASSNFTVSVATPPFELKADPSPLKLAPGGKAKLTLTATRKGYTGPIELEVRNLPANVTAPKVTIAMGQNAADLEVVAAPNAAAGDKADVHVVGTATAAGNQQVTSPNLVVSVQAAPFDLAVEPAALKLTQGAKVKLKVTAARKTYQGPIAVELRNLPANVTAGKALIPMGQNAVEIELAAADNAAVGDKADVQAAGTAEGAKEPRVSPNVTLSVLKK